MYDPREGGWWRTYDRRWDQVGSVSVAYLAGQSGGTTAFSSLHRLIVAASDLVSSERHARRLSAALRQLSVDHTWRDDSGAQGPGSHL